MAESKSQPAKKKAPATKKAPTLYVIILIKLGKGILLLLLALGVYGLSDNNLPEEFRKVVKALHFDPERQFFSDLANQISNVTPKKLLVFASGTFIYSLFSLVEGIGLIFRVSWAGWLAIGESAFFIPIEVYELSHRFSVTIFIILLLNILIVWYLLKNRSRLFKHH
jgi:uncharacterized membrane protein (DUF2068 family)